MKKSRISGATLIFGPIKMDYRTIEVLFLPDIFFALEIYYIEKRQELLVIKAFKMR